MLLSQHRPGPDQRHAAHAQLVVGTRDHFEPALEHEIKRPPGFAAADQRVAGRQAACAGKSEQLPPIFFAPVRQHQSFAEPAPERPERKRAMADTRSAGGDIVCRHAHRHSGKDATAYCKIALIVIDVASPIARTRAAQ